MGEVKHSVPVRDGARHPSAVTLWGLIALMVLMWSYNFIVGKIGLQHLDVFTLASFRVELAALILGMILLLSRKGRARTKVTQEGGPRPAPTQPKPSLQSEAKGISKGDLWTFAYLGFFGVAVNQICFTVGLNYTTVGHSSLIIGMGPIFVLLLARSQGLEHLTVLKVTGMALSFAGVAILTAEHGISLRSGTLRGDLITLAASVGFACYTVWGKKVAGKYDSVEMNAYNYFAGALLVLPLAVRQAILMGRDGSWAAVGWAGWLALLYMAGFASVGAYLIYYWALRHLAASRLAAFGYLQPVLATCLGILLLPGERVTAHLLGGGGLVLLGVYLTEVHRRGVKPGENN